MKLLKTAFLCASILLSGCARPYDPDAFVARGLAEQGYTTITVESINSAASSYGVQFLCGRDLAYAFMATVNNQPTYTPVIGVACITAQNKVQIILRSQ